MCIWIRSVYICIYIYIYVCVCIYIYAFVCCFSAFLLFRTNDYHYDDCYYNPNYLGSFLVLACLFVFLVVASTKKHGAREHNRDNSKERRKEYERKSNNTQRINHDRETPGKIDVARLHRAAFAGSAVHEPAVAAHQVAYGTQLCLFRPLLPPKILLVSPNNMLLVGLSRKRFRTEPFENAGSNALYSGSRIPGN